MWYAKVVNGSLNMRKDTSIDSERITLIPNGERIAVLDRGVVWAKAVYSTYEGYVMTKYLRFEEEDSDVPPEADSVSVSLTREAAMELYKALKASLNL